MPLYPPCDLIVLSVLVFLTASCDKSKQLVEIRDFTITLDDSGERERECVATHTTVLKLKYDLNPKITK